MPVRTRLMHALETYMHTGKRQRIIMNLNLLGEVVVEKLAGRRDVLGQHRLNARGLGKLGDLI